MSRGGKLGGAVFLFVLLLLVTMKVGADAPQCNDEVACGLLGKRLFDAVGGGIESEALRELLAEAARGDGAVFEWRSAEGWTSFIKAAGVEDLVALRLLADTPGVDINAKTIPGNETALHWAAFNGRTEAVRILASLPDLDVNAKDNTGGSALLAAAAAGHADTLAAMLLIPGIDVNAYTKDGHTALMLSAYMGHQSAVHALVAHGPALGLRLNQPDDEGYTALMFAAAFGRLDVVRYLVEVPGVEVEGAKDRDGLGAKELAASRGHAAVAKFLSELGLGVGDGAGGGRSVAKEELL
jgi:ankyrin repeat protein